MIRIRDASTRMKRNGFSLKIVSYFLQTDDDKCETCSEILEELETIDDDTDKHGIQFVKSNDAKLAAEIGVFSFPALVYYETGVPIMYDGKSRLLNPWLVRSRSTPALPSVRSSLFSFSLFLFQVKSFSYFFFLFLFFFCFRFVRYR